MPKKEPKTIYRANKYDPIKDTEEFLRPMEDMETSAVKALEKYKATAPLRREKYYTGDHIIRDREALPIAERMIATTYPGGLGAREVIDFLRNNMEMSYDDKGNPVFRPKSAPTTEKFRYVDDPSFTPADILDLSDEASKTAAIVGGLALGGPPGAALGAASSDSAYSLLGQSRGIKPTPQEVVDMQELAGVEGAAAKYIDKAVGKALGYAGKKVAPLAGKVKEAIQRQIRPVSNRVIDELGPKGVERAARSVGINPSRVARKELEKEVGNLASNTQKAIGRGESIHGGSRELQNKLVDEYIKGGQAQARIAAGEILPGERLIAENEVMKKIAVPVRTGEMKVERMTLPEGISKGHLTQDAAEDIWFQRINPLKGDPVYIKEVEDIARAESKRLLEREVAEASKNQAGFEDIIERQDVLKRIGASLPVTKNELGWRHGQDLINILDEYAVQRIPGRNIKYQLAKTPTQLRDSTVEVLREGFRKTMPAEKYTSLKALEALLGMKVPQIPQGARDALAAIAAVKGGN